jgi:hypothetical protein
MKMGLSGVLKSPSSDTVRREQEITWSHRFSVTCATSVTYLFVTQSRILRKTPFSSVVSVAPTWMHYGGENL